MDNKEVNSNILSFKSKQELYMIATIAADWGILSKDSIACGKLGNHCVIILPNKGNCEWSTSKSDVTSTNFTQAEYRLAPKEVIEKIWKKHLELAPKYHSLGVLFDSKKEGYLYYRPFSNDCFTYVNRLLTETGEEPTKLNRVIPSSDYPPIRPFTINKTETGEEPTNLNRVIPPSLRPPTIKKVEANRDKIFRRII